MLSILKRVQQQDGAELASDQHSDTGSETDSQDDVGISESMLEKLSLQVGLEVCAVHISPCKADVPQVEVTSVTCLVL